MIDQLCDSSLRYVRIPARSKNPGAIEGHGWHTKGRPYNDPLVQEHLKSGGNIGLLFGAGGVMGIDADKPEVEQITENNFEPTLKIRTGGGGALYLYKRDRPIPGIGSYTKIRNGEQDLGELRVANCQSVIPPSIHPNGNAYKVEVDAPIAAMQPRKLLEVFEPFISLERATKMREHTVPQTIDRNVALHNPFLEYVLTHRIERPTDGRHTTLFKNLAILLANAGLKNDEIRPLAIKIAGNCPGRAAADFLSWVNSARARQYEYNQAELCAWFRRYLEVLP